MHQLAILNRSVTHKLVQGHIALQNLFIGAEGMVRNIKAQKLLFVLQYYFPRNFVHLRQLDFCSSQGILLVKEAYLPARSILLRGGTLLRRLLHNIE